jgi:hypothetical protein
MGALYVDVSSSILGALAGAIYTIDPQYEALMEFIVILLAGIVIIVGLGKLNYALPAGLAAVGAWFILGDTSWTAIAFLLVAIFSMFRRVH